MGGCGRPGRVTSAPAPPPPQPESRGFGGELSQAPVESTDSVERCSGLEGKANSGISAPGPRARLGRLGRGRRTPWTRPDSDGRRAGGRKRCPSSQRRWLAGCAKTASGRKSGRYKSSPTSGPQSGKCEGRGPAAHWPALGAGPRLRPAPILRQVK
ncbi:unnamed protein product [Rangifer tarandus platyrhynchus]|uniref:Uncharacterized protein n=1 Tax=Rangifer tarandus platyrhynchus TaxID=3082113 RepID=A0AC59YTY0_RANTA